jgi:pimeloyl-ACP methyl ester carboxylesterase
VRAKVQPAIAAKTRVCAWDRAGFGLSTGVPKPQTVDQTTTDLQAVLAAGRINGPYVVVGASMGGWESLLLKDRMPSKVVGMVLVDPSFPEQNQRQDRVYSPALKAWDDSHMPPFLSVWRKCAAALRAGTLRPGAPDPDRCLSGPKPPPTYPPELAAALDKARAERTPEMPRVIRPADGSRLKALVDRSSGVWPSQGPPLAAASRRRGASSLTRSDARAGSPSRFQGAASPLAGACASPVKRGPL